MMPTSVVTAIVGLKRVEIDFLAALVVVAAVAMLLKKGEIDLLAALLVAAVSAADDNPMRFLCASKVLSNSSWRPKRNGIVHLQNERGERLNSCCPHGYWQSPRTFQ